ncbi:MAG TPA: hypothetical protein VIK86_04440 [Candidatus Paceibacterota bacterium]
MKTCNACKNRIFLNGYCKKHYIFLVKHSMLDKPMSKFVGKPPHKGDRHL